MFSRNLSKRSFKIYISKEFGGLGTFTELQTTSFIESKGVASCKFEKHLKKAGRHIGRIVVEITIKMKIIVRKPLRIKIIKLFRRNLDN